ncbi:hypothetical protein ABZX90_34365 [Streptomyces sp. NPDC002935]|uniref:hypothetical protein n=1 Tax=unclassified Streptomyces TaxID=2593676 RepID=UPI00333296CC
MGAIRSVVQQLDPSKPSLDEQKQLIETLAKLAESKAQFFELQISTSLRTAGSPDNQTIPVEAVLGSVTETHAYASKSSAAIGDTVSKALKSFCSGSKEDILTGVGALISDSLATFLGDSSASDTTLQRYYIVPEGFSIVRVDVCAWQLSIESKGIQDLAEKVSAYVAVKSAVDLTKIKFNTFLSVYSLQLEKMQLEREALEAALEEAKKIYREFNSGALTVG